jgi:cob(I)alamin adenosyltransferase
MSIVTKTGDRGTTSLMYQRQVPKTHPRVEAYGCVDELNAALGLARALGGAQDYASRLLEIQRQLVSLMGELATASEDRSRYVRDGYPQLNADHTALLDSLVRELESREVRFRGWAMPGDNPFAATLDVARTVCRRAERRVCVLQEAGELHNPEIIVYLNRLSDLLWLLARWAENEAP